MLCVCSVMSKLCEVTWTSACQSHLSNGFPRQEYWNGLPFPPLGNLEAEERINYLEDRSMEASETEIQREEDKNRTVQSRKVECFNNCIISEIGISEIKGESKEVKFEQVMVEIFCKLITNTKPSISENR